MDWVVGVGVLLGVAVVGAVMFSLVKTLSEKSAYRPDAQLRETSEQAARGVEQFGAPATIVTLRIIGWLILAGGLITCIDMWPSSDYRDLPEIFYLVPLYHLVGGIVFGVLFFAAAAALDALVRLVNK